MKKCMIVATVLAAVLIALTGCPNPAGGNKTPFPVPPPAPANYKVTFAATDTNGTLGATVDRTAITSGNKIAVGKTVVFTAKPNANYVVDKWMITGGAFEAGTGKDGSDTAKIKVNSEVTVSVSFKAATPGKHVLTFKVKGEAGGSTITAKLTDGGDIFSGNEIENGKEVEFTATPDTANGWKVKSWSIVKTADNTALSFVSGTGADGSNTAKALINEPVTVEVEFEKIKHPVTFSVDGAGGALTAKMGDTVINTGNGVEHGKTVEFTAKPASNGWKVKDWSIVKTADGTPLTFANITINQNNGIGNAYAKITEPVTVKVMFEQQFAVTFTAVNGNGTLTAKHDGKDFVSTTRLTAGKTVEFTAEPRTGYVIDKWTVAGGTLKSGGTDGSTTAMVEVGSSNVEVKVSFKWMGDAFKPNTSYKGDIKLSCWIAGMGGIDFGAGQPDKGEKYKSLLEDAYITVDGTGNATLTAKFRKSMVKIYGIDANVFIDPRNSTPGYYDMAGNKQNAVYTLSKAGDTATPPTSDPDHAAGVQYVTSMKFPVSKDKSVYHLWVYVNSKIMGVQFCDGANIDEGKPDEPNKSTKYVGKITIDWANVKETPPLSPGNYTIESDLSCVAPLMKLDMAKGNPDNGDKPLLKGTRVTVDGDGKVMLTVQFIKSGVHVGAQEVNTFIDPSDSTPGYYDMNGIKQDASYTISPEGDTATNPESKEVRYVTSMTFPASKDKDEYFLWIYINSSFMGAQFSDGKGTAGHSEPNKHSKYAGKFTVDWSTLRKE